MKTSFLGDGSLRIGPVSSTPHANGRSALETTSGSETGTSPSTKPTPEKPYIARLVLLVPAEIISLFIALKEPAKAFLPLFGVICLTLVVLVRVKATAVAGKPEWTSVGVSVVSFVLWMYSAGGSLPYLPAPTDVGIIAVSIAIWTFAVPYLYTGHDAPARGSGGNP